MDGKWFGEVSFCCCLPVLPSFAWVLINKFYQTFFSTLYLIFHLVEIFPGHALAAGQQVAGHLHQPV